MGNAVAAVSYGRALVGFCVGSRWTLGGLRVGPVSIQASDDVALNSVCYPERRCRCPLCVTPSDNFAIPGVVLAIASLVSCTVLLVMLAVLVVGSMMLIRCTSQWRGSVSMCGRADVVE